MTQFHLFMPLHPCDLRLWGLGFGAWGQDSGGFGGEIAGVRTAPLFEDVCVCVNTRCINMRRHMYRYVRTWCRYNIYRYIQVFYII